MSTWNKYLEKILDVLWILITNTFNKVDFLESIWKEFLIHWTCCVSLGFHWHTGGLDGHLIPDYTKSQWHWWTIFSHSSAGSVRSKILYFESISRLVVGSGSVSAWPAVVADLHQVSCWPQDGEDWAVCCWPGSGDGLLQWRGPGAVCPGWSTALSRQLSCHTGVHQSPAPAVQFVLSHIHDSLQSWTLFKSSKVSLDQNIP